MRQATAQTGRRPRNATRRAGHAARADGGYTASGPAAAKSRRCRRRGAGERPVRGCGGTAGEGAGRRSVCGCGGAVGEEGDGEEPVGEEGDGKEGDGEEPAGGEGDGEEGRVAATRRTPREADVGGTRRVPELRCSGPPSERAPEVRSIEASDRTGADNAEEADQTGAGSGEEVGCPRQAAGDKEQRPLIEDDGEESGSSPGGGYRGRPIDQGR